MPSKRSDLSPKAGVETPISVQAINQSEEMLWISGEMPAPDAFPPCIRAMLPAGRPGERGRHRTAAILAAFLGQVGYSRETAWQIWDCVARMRTARASRGRWSMPAGYDRKMIAKKALSPISRPGTQCGSLTGPPAKRRRSSSRREKRRLLRLSWRKKLIRTIEL